MSKNAKMKYNIQTKHVAGLPKTPYNTSNGKPDCIVMHDTGNDKSKIDGEIAYMSNNWGNAFVHAWIDADKIVETANTDYLCWGAGPAINPYAIQGELVHEHTKERFLKSLDKWIFYFAYQLYWYEIEPNDATGDGNGTVFTHEAVSKFRGQTDHVDPMPYIRERSKKLCGKTIEWKEIYSKLVEYYKALNKGDSTEVLAIGETKKVVQKAPVKVETAKVKTVVKKSTQSVYTVKNGDTLWSIANKNKVELNDLLKWNGLKTTSIIAVGQKLKLSNGAVKQKAPAKVTSTVAKKGLTKSEAMKLLETLPKKWIDNDNFPVGARFQCMDVAVWWCKQITNGAFKLEGNARDAINDKLPEGWKLIKNDPDVVPEVGDLIIYSKGWADNEYGHIAIVFKNPTLNSVIVAEQNWNGLGNTPVMTRLDYYDGASYFIRPKYA